MRAEHHLTADTVLGTQLKPKTHVIFPVDRACRCAIHILRGIGMHTSGCPERFLRKFPPSLAESPVPADTQRVDRNFNFII